VEHRINFRWLIVYNTKWCNFQLYQVENKLHSMGLYSCPLCTRSTRLVGFFIVLAHWNNSPRVDMSLHSDTLSWFGANQSLLFLLNDVYLAEKQQIEILSLIRLDRGSNPLSTVLECEHTNHYPNDAVKKCSSIAMNKIRVCLAYLYTFSAFVAKILNWGPKRFFPGQ
jgi:hypothetical protein